MKLYVVYSSSIIALFSVDVDEFKNVLDMPKHGIKLYALNVSETNADILRVRLKTTEFIAKMPIYLFGVGNS